MDAGWQQGQLQVFLDISEELIPGRFYLQDTSPAYVKNNAFYRQIRDWAHSQEIDGVVYHVLKGQIEYDFELTRLEDLFESIVAFVECEAKISLSVNASFA